METSGQLWPEIYSAVREIFALVEGELSKSLAGNELCTHIALVLPHRHSGFPLPENFRAGALLRG
jgi:hypothetical protein